MWLDFVGDDDCENCRGWDGDHRCDCGNRRVTWECANSKCICELDDEFKNCSNAYPVAY